jgi:L-ascorbate metabolism protein UlaG (beta-lactamase superfamily)
MRLTWLGHACFLIEADGKRIVTDPYNEKVPYDFPEVAADVVTVSHGHHDHNAVERVSGSPAVVEATGSFDLRGISVHGIPAVHDDQGGAERGENILYRFELEGLILAHLGDLGTALDQGQLAALKDVQILLCPVGGHYTIGPQQAAELIGGLPELRVVVPMHYKTERIPDWPIGPVDPFASLMDNVRRIGAPTVEIAAETLPDALEVWILDHA